MSLKDQMADDLTVFLNTDEFADTVTFYPKGDLVGFSCKVTFADPIPSLATMDIGLEDRRPVNALASQAVLRAGILASTSTARDPAYGDKLVAASGGYAGTWIVRTAQPDDGGGIDLALVWAPILRAGAAGAQQVRA